MVAYNLTVSEGIINLISFSYIEVFILILLILLPFFLIILIRNFRLAFTISIISYIFNHFYLGYLLTKISLLIRIVKEIDIATQLSNLILFVTAISSYYNLIYIFIFTIIILLWLMDYLNILVRK